MNGFGKKFELRTYSCLLSFIMLHMIDGGKIVGVSDIIISFCGSLIILVYFSSIEHEASTFGIFEDKNVIIN